MVTKMLSTWEEHLIDCQMVPVVDWLEFIFGPRIWREGGTQGSLAREIFKDAYLNFSHWICMEANIAGSKEGNELRLVSLNSVFITRPDAPPCSLYELTRRYWQRTSAVQCCHQQPLIDKMIPIYFKGGPKTTVAAELESRMSHIFVSDKARKSMSSKDVLHSIPRRHENTSGSDPDSRSLPYIAILVDLGQPSSLSVTFPKRDVDDRCLRCGASMPPASIPTHIHS